MSGADQLTVRVEGPDASSITLIGGPDGSVHAYKDGHGELRYCCIHTLSTCTTVSPGIPVCCLNVQIHDCTCMLMYPSSVRISRASATICTYMCVHEYLHACVVRRSLLPCNEQSS